jgi:hypothetical protein
MMTALAYLRGFEVERGIGIKNK